MPETPLRGRKSFWPVVLLGILGAGIGAYAGSKGWISLTGTSTPTVTKDLDLTSPATTAFALAGLAAWGVVLVTRGCVRRGVAIVGGLAALAPIPGMWGSTHHLLETHPASQVTAWPWIAAVALAASWGAAVLAVIWAPKWPEMGRKYDAPTAPTVLDPDDTTGLWRQLSEGVDPTDRPSA